MNAMNQHGETSKFPVPLHVIRVIWRASPAGFRALILNILDWLRISADKLRLLLQSSKLYRRALRKAIGKRIRYRLAKESDAPEVSKLLGYWLAPELSDHVKMVLANMSTAEGSDYIIVASLRNKIIGAIVIKRSADRITSGPDWWISEIRVLNRYQGAGVGRGLIIKAGYQTLKRGAKAIGGDILVDNSKAVNMCDEFKASRMTPTDYDSHFEEFLNYEANHHMIFYRSIEEGLAVLEAEGILNYYRGTGCLEAD